MIYDETTNKSMKLRVRFHTLLYVEACGTQRQGFSQFVCRDERREGDQGAKAGARDRKPLHNRSQPVTSEAGFKLLAALPRSLRHTPLRLV